MTYSVDLREKVGAFVRDGGGQAEAARRFDISLWCVGDWLARKDLQPQQKGVARRRKLDKEALRAHVRDYPEALLRERAVHFGVYMNAIHGALKQMKLTHKKRRSGTKSATRKSASPSCESYPASLLRAAAGISLMLMNPASTPRCAAVMAGAREDRKSMGLIPATAAQGPA
jgi:transposase